MSDLVEFLTARLDEETAEARETQETAAQGLSEVDWAWETNQPGYRWQYGGRIARNKREATRLTVSPERLLAEVEAKREVIKLLTKDGELDWHDLSCDWEHDGEEPIYYNETAARVLIALALPYADHPDSAQDWWP